MHAHCDQGWVIRCTRSNTLDGSARSMVFSFNGQQFIVPIRSGALDEFAEVHIAWLHMSTTHAPMSACMCRYMSTAMDGVSHACRRDVHIIAKSEWCSSFSNP